MCDVLIKFLSLKHFKNKHFEVWKEDDKFNPSRIRFGDCKGSP